MKTVGKIVVSLLSLVIVVGIVVLIVLHVRNNGKSHEQPLAVMNAVDQFCAPTGYKDTCMKSLGSVSQNKSANPRDFVLALLQSTSIELKNALEVVNKQSIDKEKEPYDHNVVGACQTMLDLALDWMEETTSQVTSSNLETLYEAQYDMTKLLTAVYAMETDCIDGFKNDSSYKAAVQEGMENARQLTYNGINIVDDIVEVLKNFSISVGDHSPTALPRGLLEDGNNVQEMGHDGYPTWFSAENRKLLTAHNEGKIVPNVVVAKDGSGKYKTINDALKDCPKDKNFQGRCIIYVKAGIYEEFVRIDKNTRNVFIYGDGPTKTIVTNSRNFNGGIPTFETATFGVDGGSGFIAKSMGFRNTAGPPGEQAVALRITADKASTFDCNIEGHQDTLYYHALDQFYRDCNIYGTIDFIFGKGTAVIQNCNILLRKPGKNSSFNVVSADGRQVTKKNRGLLIHNSRIRAEPEYMPERLTKRTFLGRPWTKDSLTVYLQNEMDDSIDPMGWHIWDGAENHKTAKALEFGNRGPGSVTKDRTKEWPKFRVLKRAGQAAKYAPGPMLGNALWLREAGVPYSLAL